MASTNQPQQQNLVGSETAARESDVDSAILQCLNQRRSCSLDDLVRTLTRFTFNQVFISVDRLSREGTVILRHSQRFDYFVSVVMSGSNNRLRAQENRQDGQT